MKTRMILFAALFFSVVISAQHYENKNIRIEYPNFEKGSLDDFLLMELVYPNRSEKLGVQGTVVVKFTVNPEGELSNFRIINSVSDRLDSEVIYALKESEGKWNPGQINGQPVKMDQEFSVAFMLHPEVDFIKEAEFYFHKGNQILHQQQDPERALRFFNCAMKYMPYETSILNARALCKYMMGDQAGAVQDVGRVVDLLGRESGQCNPLIVSK